MILIGQFDSPFVRRVGIALTLYGVPFEHQPWSAFGDTAKISAFNPLSRVPTLVLDDGEVLIESHAILDYLDERAGPDDALMARGGVERRQALKVCALATGLADKAVSLIYEGVLHAQTSDFWLERCKSQIAAVAGVLETDRAARATPFWFGETIGHADIAVACALIFTREAHPGSFDLAAYPALTIHAERCEALPAFRDVAQTFDPPKG